MTVDLALFMGQSNMAGRGDWRLAPVVPEGMGYEYRAVSDPGALHAMREPFGKDENRPGGIDEPGMKTGSLVSAFTAAFTGETGVPIVSVSASKGGSAIAQWLPGTDFYRDAVSRAAACEAYLKKSGIAVRRRFMVWCQGCTDGDLRTPPDVYKEDTRAFIRSLMEETGAEVCFLIRIGNHRDDPERYAPIRDAQEALCREEPDIVMVSRCLSGFAAAGMMKDVFHYIQPAYDIAGREAGQAAGAWLIKHTKE